MPLSVLSLVGDTVGGRFLDFLDFQFIKTEIGLAKEF
jgi:hypothetical protein